MQNFKDYFNEWLYGNNGYYVNYKHIGKDGDFFTSVSSSSFFGGAIAKQIIKSIQSGFLSKNTKIVEIGAHYGYLMADIIQFIYTFEPKLLKTLEFIIVERFEDLQIKQNQYLYKSFSNHINLKHVNNIKELKEKEAFIYSNEIFDAFPCNLVYTDENNCLKEAFIQDNTIKFKKCKNKNIIKHCKDYDIKKGEVCLDYELFINDICNNIKHFEFISFDYGDKYPRNDYSIRIYKQHEVFPLFEKNLNLENFYKNSDITYDVHFNYLKDLFIKNDVENLDVNTQANKLIEFGILDLLEILKANVNETIYLKEVQKVKKLLEPTGMGDRFKVIHAKRFYYV